MLQGRSRKAAPLPSFYDAEADLDPAVLIIIGSDRPDDYIVDIHHPRIDVFAIVPRDKFTHGFLCHLQSRVGIPSGVSIHRRIRAQILIQAIRVLRAVSAQNHTIRPQFDGSVYFDFLYANDLRTVKEDILNEDAVFVSAVLTLQEISIPVLRHAGEGFSPFIRNPDVFPIVF